ncbi:hypothetical protein NMG60_11005123 [Bertholletia excelsa]
MKILSESSTLSLAISCRLLKLTCRSNFEKAVMPEEEERKPVKAECSKSPLALTNENYGDGGANISFCSLLADDISDGCEFIEVGATYTTPTPHRRSCRMSATSSRFTTPLLSF